MFTKNDLKSGDVIVRRNGNVEIVCLETRTLITRNGFNMLEDTRDDLTEISSKEWDIMQVYRPTEPHHCQFKESVYKQGRLVFDREVEEDNSFIYPNGKTAKENHIDMWNYLADHPDKHKRDWFREFWGEEWERPQGDCFACDACNCDCSICPLGEDNIGCAGGLFCTWSFYPDGYERATYAHQIANLEWKEK